MTDFNIVVKADTTTAASAFVKLQNDITNMLKSQDASQRKILAQLSEFDRFLGSIVQKDAQAVALIQQELVVRTQNLATLGATEAQLVELNAKALAWGEANRNAFAGSVMVNAPQRLRSIANAGADVTMSLAGMATSARSGFDAVAQLSTQVSMLAKSANVAAGASGIAALSIAIGTLITMQQRARKPSEEFLENLRGMDFKEAAAEVARLEAELKRLEQERFRKAGLDSTSGRVAAQIQAMNPGREFSGLTLAGPGTRELQLVNELAMARSRSDKLGEESRKRDAEHEAEQRRMANERAAALQVESTMELKLSQMRAAGATARQIADQQAIFAHQKELEQIREIFTIRNREHEIVDVINDSRTKGLVAQATAMRDIQIQENAAAEKRRLEDLRVSVRTASGTPAEELEGRIEQIRLNSKREADTFKEGSEERQLIEQRMNAQIKALRDKFNREQLDEARRVEEERTELAQRRLDIMLDIEERAARTEGERLAVTFARIDAERDDRLKTEGLTDSQKAAINVDAERQKRQARADAASDWRSIERGMNTGAGMGGAALSEIDRVREEAALLLEIHGEHANRRILIEENMQAQISEIQGRHMTSQLAQTQRQFAALAESTKRRWGAMHSVAAGAAEGISRVLMVVEAAHAAQMALKEKAAAVAALALPIPDVRGAALHYAAAAGYAAAALMGGISAATGGGAGGGGGGGGGFGSGTESPGFSPRSVNDQPTSVIVNLITKDPYGSDQINQTIYQINRAGILNRPIPVYPTTGIDIR